MVVVHHRPYFCKCALLRVVATLLTFDADKNFVWRTKFLSLHIAQIKVCKSRTDFAKVCLWGL